MDHDVQACWCVHGGLDRSGDVGGAAQVGADGADRAGTGGRPGADQACHLVDVRVAVDEDDVGALGLQPCRQGAADPRGGAGDERAPTGESRQETRSSESEVVLGEPGQISAQTVGQSGRRASNDLPHASHVQRAAA